MERKVRVHVPWETGLGGDSENGEGEKTRGERDEEERIGPHPLGLGRPLPREHPHGCRLVARHRYAFLWPACL